MSRSLLVSSLLGLLAATSVAACSSASEEEDSGGDQGALVGDLLSKLTGGASIGRTLPENFRSMKADEKQKVMFDLASSPKWLRCNLGADIKGDALVSKLLACPVTTDDDDLKKPTLLGMLESAAFDGVVAMLEKGGMLSPAFDEQGDEMKENRKRLLQPYAAFGKIEVRIDAASPYTGVLAPGAVVPGILRLSSGGDEEKMGVAPGMGIKLFITGDHSADIQAVHTLAPQTLGDGKTPDHNLLRHVFSNDIIRVANEGGGGKIQVIFKKVHNTSTRIPVDHLSRRTVDGKVETQPKGPEDITFDPTPEATRAFQDFIDAHPDKDPRVALAAITKDATPEHPVVLYKLRPAAGKDVEPVVMSERETKPALKAIGTVVATGPFIPSKWGDQQFYVRHNRGCVVGADASGKNKEITTGAAKGDSLCTER